MLKNKESYQNIFKKLISPLIKYYSDNGASLSLGITCAGYGNDIAKMEGFSRVLWGFVPFLAGGGKDEKLLEIYKKGLKNGTDPECEEFWGNLGPFDQRMVEMAAISYAILMQPNNFWYPLNEKEKSNLSNWLYQINLYDMPENNWQFFRVITNLALKSVNEKYDIEQTKLGIERYESYYLENGWYSDGNRPQKDYYTSFGIHFYCLIYAKFMEKEDPKRSKLFKERACEFAKTFIYWFDDEGKALPFGRSLTYRFAQIAFWSATLLAGVETFPVGVVKGIITRHFEYWLKQPIFDNDNILTVGYTYPNLIMSEAYNSATSPYWAFKSFSFLALPDNHEFWHCESLPLPELESPKLIKEAGMLMSKSKFDISALTVGQYLTKYNAHGAEKYAKFAYSSALGFSVPRSYHILEEVAPDSMLCFKVNDMFFVRRKCIAYSVFEDKLVSTWSPLDGIEVETILIPTDKGHIRKHKIVSKLDCVAYESGFSYPRNIKEIKYKTEEGHSCVFDENGKSEIKSNIGKAIIINSAPNTNLIFPLTAIPSIEIDIKIGTTLIESIIETEFVNKAYVGGDCYKILN